MLAADFQSILAALLLLERLPNGRYPNRNPAQAAWLLPMVEAVRQTVITIATDREIDVVTTNSDGSPARRAFLLSRLGPGSVETILDPGIDVVTQRLAGARTWSHGTVARQAASNRSGLGASSGLFLYLNLPGRRLVKFWLRELNQKPIQTLYGWV